MEYDLAADGTLTPLPQQNIDTGLGLERGAMLLQDVELDLRHRRLPGDHAVGGRGVGCRLRRLRAGDQGAPRSRRPRPRDGVPDLRGHHAVERGARLHRAPPHPPSRAAGQPDRADRRLPAAGDRDRAGRGRLPRAGRAGRRDRARRQGGGGALRRDARARPQGLRGARRQGRDLGRGRVHARSHLRLSARADDRARRGAWPAGRRRRLPRPDGGAPHDLACRR